MPRIQVRVAAHAQPSAGWNPHISRFSHFDLDCTLTLAVAAS